MPEPKPRGWEVMACEMASTQRSLTDTLSQCRNTATNGRSASSCASAYE